MNSKLKKYLVVFVGGILFVLEVCNLFGIGKILLSSAIGQVPIIGTICTIIDFVDFLKAEKEFVKSSDPFIHIGTLIQYGSSLWAGYKAWSYSKDLEKPYCWIVGFIVCSLVNVAISNALFELVNWYQGAFLTIENGMNELFK